MIKAVIVDDELKAIKILTVLLETYCQEVSVINYATSAFDAVSIILKEKPDVVFLDINMPGHNGFDVLEKIRSEEIKIIFTTAHKDFAINAIKQDAFDYLLKPIDTDELQLSVKKLARLIKPREVNPAAPIQVSLKEGIIFIDPQEIVKLEASGSYTDIYTDNNKKITTSKLLREFELILDCNAFYRCHKSYIVNLFKIKKLLNDNGSYFIEFKDGTKADVSKKNKENLLAKMKKQSS
jgi:two-component system LytT family response regulator